jgi:hypothetical protein
MAITLPVYINVDTQTSAALQNGTARGEAANTNPSAVDQGGAPISRGLVRGVRIVKSATAGAVILKVFSDSGGTAEIFNETLTFSSPAVALSAEVNVPFFSGLWWTVTGDASSATHTCKITFVVRSIAGNG